MRPSWPRAAVPRLTSLIGAVVLLGPVLSAPPLVADVQPGRGTGAPSVAREAVPTDRTQVDKDFNGDSYGDLVIGTPVGLYVLSGSPVGLSADRREILSLQAVAGRRPVGSEATFGTSTASGDFDSDTYTDLAVWIDDDGKTAHGLHVLYGSPGGLDVTRHSYRAFPRRDTSPPLASGNFGRGAHADLAIGDWDFRIDGDYTGAVHVLYGGTAGLTGPDLQTWTQDSPGVLGAAENGDYFGSSLVADNFGGHRYDDLAIGNPTEGTDDEGSPGAVQVLYGSASGLTADGNQLWSQQTPGLRVPRSGTNSLGDSLAAGHFAGGKYADLAIGSASTGTVNVIYGSPDGLTVAGNQLWSQNGRRIKGRVGYDYFGATLAAANFGKDRDDGVYDDLAVGSPENKSSSGAVHVLFGSRRGLTSVGDQRWDQFNRGIPGVRESPDRFGGSLAAADFGSPVAGRRYADLAVASKQEYVRGIDEAGMVHVLYGTADGLRANGVQVCTEDRLGGTVQDHGHGEGLGWVLASSSRQGTTG